jgi:hypothetical protein
MSEIPLGQAVREHIEDVRLSDAQFAELQAMQAAPRPSRRWVLGGLVAAVAAVAVWGGGARVDPLAEAIAQEVARNHIKLKPLEVESARMDDVRAFFGELDFVPIDSAVVAASGTTLLGGRYCSLQGVQAAQLRVADGDDVHSLYMAPDRAQFDAIPDVSAGGRPWRVYANGLEVQIWREQDVVLAMTR